MFPTRTLIIPKRTARENHRDRMSVERSTKENLRDFLGVSESRTLLLKGSNVFLNGTASQAAEQYRYDRFCNRARPGLCRTPLQTKACYSLSVDFSEVVR